MLNREFMEELIIALESGNYKKGKGFLRTEDDTFCCLGVACDLMSKKGKGSWGGIIENDEMRSVYLFEYKRNDEYYPPVDIAEKMGLEDEQFMYSLASINDKSETFEPVIKAIRKKLAEEANA